MEAFIKNEEKKIVKAKFKAKNQTIIEINISRDFNSCYIIIKAESIMVVQKNQIAKFVLINVKNNPKNYSL